jgi:hypothetical protein
MIELDFQRAVMSINAGSGKASIALSERDLNKKMVGTSRVELLTPTVSR